MSFRDKLIQLRNEQKLSQQEFADMLDVARQTVSRWESGKSVPSSNQIANICKVFHIQPNELVETESGVYNTSEQPQSTATSPTKKPLTIPLLVIMGILLLIAVGGLIATIVYAVKDAAYDTSATAWIVSIPRNTPIVILAVFLGIFIVLVTVLIVLLVRSRKK